MNVKEYIKAKLGKFNLSQSDIDVIIKDNNLNGNISADINLVKLAIYKSISEWLPLHNSITEGGVNETWNYEALKLYYSLLCEELGKDNVIEKIENKTLISDRSNVW